ncbi:MAG: non-homologous end-joining DNA ligase [Acidimicrobiales bacterium]
MEPDPTDSGPAHTPARTTAPGFRVPMLATLAEPGDVGDGWVVERKFDGIRLVVVRDGDDVALWTRNHNRRDGSFPDLVAALREQPVDRFVADGEVVAFEDGRDSFAALHGGGAVLFLFDLMHLDGHDLDDVPLVDRRRLLEQAVVFDAKIRFSPSLDGDATALLTEACAQGWEGLVAKRAGGRYVHGRSRDWLKLKCVRRQEMVIGGFTDPKGSRTGLGALLVGHHDGGDLVYAGRVGTGFDESTLVSLIELLEARRRENPPFTRGMDKGGPPKKASHWVNPDLVCEIGFAEWTPDGKLRHPRFLGLRDDKDASAVVREDDVVAQAADVFPDEPETAR